MSLPLSFELLAPLNALLNAAAGFTILAGHHALVRRGDIPLHRRLMIRGVVLSALFLVSYLVYHATCPPFAFLGRGWTRLVYFPMLISHILLAMALVPLVLFTLKFGLARRDPEHRKLARWTYPLWLYVSATGVLVYLSRYVR